MLEPGLYSSRIFSHFREESGDEELSVLPRHTKVIVTGNNRTKSVLVGLQGVVKKAVGLGGWHWLVLKNGVEVKLQRNALSVLEPPTGHEEDGDYEFDNSSCGSDVGEKDNFFAETTQTQQTETVGEDFIDLDEDQTHQSTNTNTNIESASQEKDASKPLLEEVTIHAAAMEFNKPSKPRVRYTKPWGPSPSTKPINRTGCREAQSNTHPYYPKVNFAKLGTNTLWRYYSTFNLGNIQHNPTKEQLVDAIQKHFASQKVSEVEVIMEFIHAAKRQKSGRTNNRDRS